PARNPSGIHRTRDTDLASGPGRCCDRDLTNGPPFASDPAAAAPRAHGAPVFPERTLESYRSPAAVRGGVREWPAGPRIRLGGPGPRRSARERRAARAAMGDCARRIGSGGDERIVAGRRARVAHARVLAC